jgi:CDP-diacylglycerol---glycerol-3-phosphate 3-phosphatidyltransferase
LISAKLGHSLDPLILSVYRFFLKSKIINPNILTVWGATFAFGASACIAFDYLLVAAILILISGCFDLMDGAVARSTDNVTRFGGFLDSVLDRYADLFIMFGIFIHFLRHNDLLYSGATFVAAIGSAIIPYARARAEAASLPCKTGMLERPERLIIILVGLFFYVLSYAVIVLAVLTHVTAIQRMVYVRRNSDNI